MPHLTVAANETAFITLLNAIRDEFVYEDTFSATTGGLTASAHIKIHLANGSVDLRGDGTVQVSELDIKWDALDLSLAFDIPEQCFGGFCIIPTPFGCALEFPEVCLFSDNPDLAITLPLGGFTSEASLTGSLQPVYFVNPDRPAGMNDWDAQDAQPPLNNEWRIHLVPQFVDVDLIDLADTVGDILEAAVNTLVDDALSFLPGFIRDIIKGILGSAIDILRLVIDIPDDIGEFLEDLLNVNLGLINSIGAVLIAYLSKDNPLARLEDPYPILEAAANPNDSPPGPPQLVPVKVPIRDLTVSNNDVEMILTANVG
jgi:hypothetical protein